MIYVLTTSHLSVHSWPENSYLHIDLLTCSTNKEIAQIGNLFKKHWKDMDAGHYVPKTAGLALYFNEQNVNAQCTYCNRWMHGNLSRYAIALRRKYGQNILEELDKKRQKIIQITIPEYQKHIETYRLKIKKLEAGLPDPSYPQ